MKGATEHESTERPINPVRNSNVFDKRVQFRQTAVTKGSQPKDIKVNFISLTGCLTLCLAVSVASPGLQ